MTKQAKTIDSRGNTIENTRESHAHIPNRAEANPDRIKTIGRLHYTSRRWTWAVRFELAGDMSIKPFDDGSKFEPVEQCA